MSHEEGKGWKNTESLNFEIFFLIFSYILAEQILAEQIFKALSMLPKSFITIYNIIFVALGRESALLARLPTAGREVKI